MRFIDKKQKLDYLIELIKKENTGTAKELADRLCVSLPTIENYMSILREEGYKISYCTLRRTYYLVEK